MKTRFTESIVEDATLGWFREMDYVVLNESEEATEKIYNRKTNTEVFFDSCLRDALRRLNPNLADSLITEAVMKLTNPQGETLEDQNREFHRMLVNGISVHHQDENGNSRTSHVNIVDYKNPEYNFWGVVSQFTVVENKNNRRPDVVVFLNGLPVTILELKNPAAQSKDIWSAYRQIRTYKSEIPSLFIYNELLVISDGISAQIGTLTAKMEWFKKWKTVEGISLASSEQSELEVLLKGVFEKRRFLSLIRNFIVFENSGYGKISKNFAGYHQFHAVNVAIEETLRATKCRESEVPNKLDPSTYDNEGDQRIGVVWHTQGSGKSLTMAFYAGRVIQEPKMANPTIVVITDRNDLDNQLFSQFVRCQELLRQLPVQVESRSELRNKLSVVSGGVIFATIQKFFPDEKGSKHPLLSCRKNIVVIADEAHRSQYEFIDGFAAHMRSALPNASFIGFTGTPIERHDANTRAVFGNYISIYDIKRAVEDKATVQIFYENRLAKISLDEEEKPKIDAEFEEATEREEVTRREKLKTKWAKLEAVVGAKNRLKLIANDIINHFEIRIGSMEGKAMIVCMSRRICTEVYKEIVKLKPDWESEHDNKGKIKIVMTGSASDPSEWQKHIRSKQNREVLANRFRDPEDPLSIVIVRDMWLTGFDAPCLHTMYVDKPMRGHGLMQAIARVNRVYKDKQGGLIVDYLGIASELKKAMHSYTSDGGEGTAVLHQADAVVLMLEKYEICRRLFHGFGWSGFRSGTPQEQVSLLPAAQEHILAQENGKERCIQFVSELSKAFNLAVPHEDALKISDDVAFFNTVAKCLAKPAPSESPSEENVEHAVRQIISKAIVSSEVVDIYDAAGIRKPDISILSEEFLAEVRGLSHRNLAIELLHKLLRGEITTHRRKNVVQARSFAEMLENAIQRYKSKAVSTVTVLEELIILAGNMRRDFNRGDELGLTEDELAFYDALSINGSAVEILGDQKLKEIAQDLVDIVRKNVKIDWTIRREVQATLRLVVKKTLRKHSYPQDKEDKATNTVLEQAEVLSADWDI